VTDPASYRPAQGTIPTEPGVYRFRDPQGRVVYVGKAKNLRARLANYFQPLPSLHPRTQAMVTTAIGVEWTVVGTEVEALQLEYTWIKEFDPRFNVRYRGDDKPVPRLAVSLDEQFPRAQVERGPKQKGVRYFSPYTHGWAIEETVNALLRAFPIRSCSTREFHRAQATGRPCLLGHIGKCSAPCAGWVSAEEHRAIAEDLCRFLAGQSHTHLRRLEQEMREAAAALEFEKAARLRDAIGALDQVLERSAVLLGEDTDADVIGISQDELEAAVQVFHVRGGRVRGQRGWVVDRVEDLDTASLVERFLVQLYGGQDGEDDAEQDSDGNAERNGEPVPRVILVPVLPPDPDAVTALLGSLRSRKGKGARAAVRLRVPLRGDKRALMDIVERNAHQTLALHKTKRAGDLNTRSRALEDIADALDLAGAPLRIECYDISRPQGAETVASMVVFEDALPRKAEYRRFSIKTADDPDEARSVYEVITRRFRRHPAVGGAPAAEPDQDIAPTRSAYPPYLILVDGGPRQVAAATAALADLGVTAVAVAGLTTRIEEVWLPGRDEPAALPRTGEAIHLLQRVRDETHRFARARPGANRRTPVSVPPVPLPPIPLPPVPLPSASPRRRARPESVRPSVTAP
jgi:excinuclease ABC subunit C